MPADLESRLASARKSTLPTARGRRGAEPPSTPAWLRALAVVCAATSRLGGVAGTPTAAPGPMSPMRCAGLLPPAVAGTPRSELIAAAPVADPDLADFLAGSADPDACHWGLDGASLWGEDDVVLSGDGHVKAYEIRALGPDEQERAAALGSILGQASARLRDFARPHGNQTLFTVLIPAQRPHVDRQGDRILTLAIGHSVPLYANGSRAAYAGRSGLLAPLTRKLALHLRHCDNDVRFDTGADVFDAVLGNSAVEQVLGVSTLAGALRRAYWRPVFGVMKIHGGIHGGLINATHARVESSAVGVHLVNRAAQLDLDLANNTSYGLLEAQLDRPPYAVSLYNPLGTRGPVDPPPTDFRGNASTLVQRMPLLHVGDGVDAELTLAT